MGIATLTAVVSIAIGYAVYRNGPLKTNPLRPLQVIFENKFWIDELYDLLFVRPFNLISSFLAKIVDKRIIDGIVHLPGYVSRGGAAALSLIQMGSVQFYLLILLMGGFVVLWFSLKGGI
jgi:NADH-quinone oxidoreductase subunit L